MRLRIAVALFAIIGASCTADAGSSTSLEVTTSSPSAPGATTTSTSAGPDTTQRQQTTTTSASSTTTSSIDQTEFASGAGVTLATSAECAGLSDPIAAGSVTWSDGERLWEGAIDAENTCLFHVSGALTSLEWAPQGDRMLANGRLIVGGPASGQTAPAGVEWAFTAPTGRNLVGIDNGSLVKWLSEDGAVTAIDPITDHTTVAYHPSGLHLAVGGADQPEEADLDSTEGIFVAGSDGSDPVNLILGFGTTIRDISFSADGSHMYFIAEHDGLIHFHSVSMVPDDVDGTLVLGAGAEEFATTHATASGGGRIEFAQLIVHPRLPAVAAWTTPECEEAGSRGFQVIAGADGSLVQALGPASALGFLDSGPSTVIVAAMSGDCDSPRDLGLMTASLETGEVNSVPITTNATVAAVRNINASHEYDLVDVQIAGFA